VAAGDEETLIPFVHSPEAILVVAAGGVGGRFSAWIPGFTSRRASRAVTVPISAE
jgi:hypothetical protein